VLLYAMSIPEHTVSKREVEMVRSGKIHVRLLDMDGIYHDEDEYILIQHFEEGDKRGEVACPKDDVENLIDGLQWYIQNDD